MSVNRPLSPMHQRLVQFAVREAALQRQGLEVWRLADGHIVAFGNSSVPIGHVQWANQPFGFGSRIDLQ